MTTETLAAAPVAPLAPLSIAELGAHARALREQVAHAFIGQAVVFDQVLLALLAVLAEGPYRVAMGAVRSSPRRAIQGDHRQDGQASCTMRPRVTPATAGTAVSNAVRSALAATA